MKNQELWRANPTNTDSVEEEFLSEEKIKRIETRRDFPGSLVLKNLPSDAEDVLGLIPALAPKIPHAIQQLSPCTATTT